MACTNLNYTLYSNQSQEQLYLTVEETTQDEAIEYYNKKKKIYMVTLQTTTGMGGISDNLFVTPVFITIKLQPCPPGFTLLGDPPGCDCYPALTKRDVRCIFINGTGYLMEWSYVGEYEQKFHRSDSYCRVLFT